MAQTAGIKRTYSGAEPNTKKAAVEKIACEDLTNNDSKYILSRFFILLITVFYGFQVANVEHSPLNTQSDVIRIIPCRFLGRTGVMTHIRKREGRISTFGVPLITLVKRSERRQKNGP